MLVLRVKAATNARAGHDVAIVIANIGLSINTCAGNSAPLFRCLPHGTQVWPRGINTDDTPAPLSERAEQPTPAMAFPFRFLKYPPQVNGHLHGLSYVLVWVPLSDGLVESRARGIYNEVDGNDQAYE